jgi:SAM-dependent methyltransferase
VARSDETTRTTIAAYDALAPIYDSLGGWRWFGGRVVERLEALVANRGLGQPRSGATPLTMLDLGCGGGWLLAALHAAHPDWRLAGADASQAMLRETARATRSAAVLARATMPAALPFGPVFDVVGSFHDTLNHLPDDAALTATFQAVAAVLRPRGLFAFDVTNEEGFTAWWRRGVDVERDGFHYLCAFDYDPGARVATADIALRRGETRQTLTITQRYFSDPVVEIALRAAGFRLEIAAPWAALGNVPGKTWYVAQNDTPFADPR